MVTRESGYHVPQFRVTRGKTQGGLSLSMLFKVDVDSVDIYWLLMTVYYGLVVNDRLGQVTGQSLGVYYVDDGILGYSDLECMQGALNVLIGIFCRTELAANVANSKTMDCHMGSIRLGMSQEAFLRSSIGEGATYWEHLRICVPFPDCMAEMMFGYLKTHRRSLHCTKTEINWNRLLVIQIDPPPPQIYIARPLT